MQESYYLPFYLKKKKLIACKRIGRCLPSLKGEQNHVRFQEKTPTTKLVPRIIIAL